MLRPTIMQGEQAPLLQLSDGQLAVRVAGFALQTEAANPHANPLIQTSEGLKDLCRTEIVGVSSNDRVKVLDDSLDVPPFMERETEIPEDLLSVGHSESGFLWRFRENDEVIGVSDMPPTFGFDLLVKGVEDNIGEQRRDDAAFELHTANCTLQIGNSVKRWVGSLPGIRMERARMDAARQAATKEMLKPDLPKRLAALREKGSLKISFRFEKNLTVSSAEDF
jgi:hypothetical protein